jgi:hypothetical protein
VRKALTNGVINTLQVLNDQLVYRTALTATMAVPDIRVTLFCDSQTALLAIHKFTNQSNTVLKAVMARNAFEELNFV